jgi:glyoxylase-like metal-dependent hydrolase (beta-lactamase superfamily II)
MELASGIHRVEGVRANPYFIVGEELVLVDAGMSRKSEGILAYLKDTLKRKPSDLGIMIITHSHFDHTGGLAVLVRATGAKVAIHSADAPYVAGEKRASRPKGGMGVLFRLLSPFIRPAPVKADILLNDGDMIAGMKVIHIPGHTLGSIALLDEKRKALFPGDTLRLRDGRVEGPPENFTQDPGLARRSIEKLKLVDFEAMLPGHGEPLLAGASEAVRRGKY